MVVVPARGDRQVAAELTSLRRREALWRLVSDVECITLRSADKAFLREKLNREKMKLAAADGPWTEPPWIDVYGEKNSPDNALTRLVKQEEEVRRELIELAKIRARRRDARAASEQVYHERMLIIGITILTGAVLLVTLFAWATNYQDRLGVASLVRSALALVAGALGGTVARAIQLRDTPLGTLETQRFGRALFVQGAIGGCFGGIALVLVQLEVLPQIGNGSDVATTALYAFLAGWSEPFILGTLSRFATVEAASSSGRT